LAWNTYCPAGHHHRLGPDCYIGGKSKTVTRITQTVTGYIGKWFRLLISIVEYI